MLWNIEQKNKSAENQIGIQEEKMLVMESRRGLGPAAQEADEDVVGEALVEDLGEEVEVGDERGLQDDGPGQGPWRGSRGGKGAHFPS